jgi:hypothetical protein
MDKEIIVKLDVNDCEVIMRGLMELSGKIMLQTMQKFDTQVKKQLEETEHENSGQTGNHD